MMVVFYIGRLHEGSREMPFEGDKGERENRSESNHRLQQIKKVS